MTKVKWLGLCSIVFSLLIACQPAAAPVTQSPATTTVAPKQVTVWDETVAKAKQEGELVISSACTAPVREAITKAFMDTYGIRVEFIGGGKSAELVTKLLNERKAGVFAQDIFISGATSVLTGLRPAGGLDPLEPVLMLPGVLNKNLWIGGEYFWADNQHTIIVAALMPNPGTGYVINSTMVKPEEVKVYDDFISPKWRGKIVMNDPTVLGPGNRFVSVVATKVKSWDYMKTLAKLEPVINRDQRLQMEWVARGKYAIGLGIEPTLVTEFIEAGAPILEVTPLDDFTASSGPNTVALINKAAHPNAAKVFVNWILDKEGQTVLSRSGGIASVKTDVPTDHLRPQRRLDPAKKYFIVDQEDYLAKMDEYIVISKEIFAQLLK